MRPHHFLTPRRLVRLVAPSSFCPFVQPHVTPAQVPRGPWGACLSSAARGQGSSDLQSTRNSKAASESAGHVERECMRGPPGHPQGDPEPMGLGGEYVIWTCRCAPNSMRDKEGKSHGDRAPRPRRGLPAWGSPSEGILRPLPRSPGPPRALLHRKRHQPPGGGGGPGSLLKISVHTPGATSCCPWAGPWVYIPCPCREVPFPGANGPAMDASVGGRGTGRVPGPTWAQGRAAVLPEGRRT